MLAPIRVRALPRLHGCLHAAPAAALAADLTSRLLLNRTSL